MMKKYLLFGTAMLLAFNAYASTDELVGAAQNGDWAKVQDLISAGDDINGTNAAGNTALHYAVNANNIDMIRFLLDHGAKSDIENTKGWSAFSIAEKKGNEAVVNLINSHEFEDDIDAIVESFSDAEVKAPAVEAPKVEVKAPAVEAPKVEVKVPTVEAPKVEVKTVAKPVVKAAPKPTPKPAPKFIPSSLNKNISAGDEEIVYCLYYLGLQTNEHNMVKASEFFAGSAGISKERHEKIAAAAHQYYDNASEAEMKQMAEKCSVYITPKNTEKQNQIIRSMNKSVGY